MQRGELALGAVLLAILAAGIVFENYQGADKSADLIITHSNEIPFDAAAPPPQIASSAPTPRPAGDRVRSSSDSTSTALLQFLNQAGPDELLEVPGIGPVLARRILDKRAVLGTFTDIKQINEVSGIGKAKMNDLLNYAESLSKRPTPANRPAAPAPAFTSPSIPRHRPTVVSQPPKKKPLNQATREDLMKVSGIGEHLADALLQARDKNQGFKSWKEVDAVSGIGASRLKQLQEYFTLPE